MAMQLHLTPKIVRPAQPGLQPSARSVARSFGSSRCEHPDEICMIHAVLKLEIIKKPCSPPLETALQA